MYTNVNNDIWLKNLVKTVKLIEDSEPAIIIKFTKFEYSKAFSAFGMRVKKYIKQSKICVRTIMQLIITAWKLPAPASAPVLLSVK